MNGKRPLSRRISISHVGADNLLGYDLVLVGEEHGNMDHYDKESRLIKDLTNTPKKVVLATEYFSPEHQERLDMAARRGDVTTDQSLTSILRDQVYAEDWKLEREARAEVIYLYNTIFRLCERVIGINQRDMATKDKEMVDAITKEMEQYGKKEKLMVAIVGSTHVEPVRMPLWLDARNVEYAKLKL